MPKSSTSPTAIGAFVLGAIAIAIGAVVYFGSGSWGTDKREFACFFREGVDGLQVGAKVTFKGVPIGSVERILVRFESQEGSLTTLTTSPNRNAVIPVIFSIDSHRVLDDLGVELGDDLAFHKEQIESGLRAKLKSTSMITGLLFIDLDYYPGPPLPETTFVTELDGEEIFNIPTEPSDLTALKEQAYAAINRLGAIDFEAVVEDLSKLLSSLGDKAEAFDVEELNAAITAVKETVASPKIEEALAAIEGAGEKIGTAAESLQGEVSAWGVGELITDLRRATRSLEETIEKAGDVFEEEGQTRQELDRALGKVADAASEIEELAAYVKERPNSLIFGRKDKKSDGGANAGRERSGRPFGHPRR